MSNVTLKFDKQVLKARLVGVCKEGTTIMANELLKDSNKFVRFRVGELKRSSLRASEPEKGILRWDTPYAKRVYYVGEPSKVPNPDASLMWAHRAMKENRQKYLRMLQKLADQKGGQ